MITQDTQKKELDDKKTKLKDSIYDIADKSKRDKMFNELKTIEENM